MDVNELARSLQALMEVEKPATHEPQPQDVLLVSAPEPLPEPEPDPFFEHYFTPKNDYTTALPTYPHDSEDPYGVFDDDLLNETEETGDVKITNVANALYRAKRTGAQGLIASVLVAVAGAVAAFGFGAEIDWRLLGLTVGQAALTAVITFLHNDKAAETDSAE
jgi:hypothetical protein